MSRGTEAVEQMFLLQCVLIQILLITFSASAEEVICHNVTATVGKPLNLTCTVKCEECRSEKYKWFINGTELEKGMSNGRLTFNYTIKKISVENNGTYNFWVQLNSGSLHAKFTVFIPGENDAVVANPDPGTWDYDVVAVSMAVISVAIILIILGVIYRHQCNIINICKSVL